VGYKTTLFDDNPDIIVETYGYKYAIECKRIYKEESFISNIKEAKKQLVNNSIGKKSRRGLIAISVTRAFNSGGTKKLVTETAQEASESVDSVLEAIYKENVGAISELLPYTIPGLLLEYSDIAEINVPYWIHKMLFARLANTGSAKVLNDFDKLIKMV
jgi:hypothetical protein